MRHSIVVAALIVSSFVAGCKLPAQGPKDHCTQLSDCIGGQTCVLGQCRVLGSAGLIVTPLDGLMTSEGGAPATFTVVLTSLPTVDVTLPIVSSAPTEGTVSPASLTFTPSDWDQPQTVTVTGVDDQMVDVDQPYLVRVGPGSSHDSRYAGLAAVDVQAVNVDNHKANVVISPINGLTTAEGGGTATFVVSLATRPTGEVSFDLASSDAKLGTVSPRTLTFHALDWNIPQTVTVTGGPGGVDDSDHPYSVVTSPCRSSDADYDALDPVDVHVLYKNTTAGSIKLVDGPQTIAEGGRGTWTLALATQPAASVRLQVTTSDASVVTAGAPVTLTPTQYQNGSVELVAHAQDHVITGDQVVHVNVLASSADGVYDGVKASFDVTIHDVDQAGVIVSQTPLSVVEFGTPATFTVQLTCKPTADVVFSWPSGTIALPTVRITPDQWNVPQTIQVSAVEDEAWNAPTTQMITVGPAQSGDAHFDGVHATGPTVTRSDGNLAFERVSLAPGGEANAASGGTRPAVSGDGRFVAFASSASNLVAGDTNGVDDVFVYDHQTGATERVNVGPNGAQANAAAASPGLSRDGNIVVFVSSATNLVAGVTGTQIYAYDRTTQKTTVVSETAAHVPGDSPSDKPSISADGRYVAFESYAQNLVGAVTTVVIVVHDRQTGTNQLASGNLPAVAGSNADAHEPKLNADGSVVAFYTNEGQAINEQALVHDLGTGVTEIVTVDEHGAPLQFGGLTDAITDDGRYVLFTYETGYYIYDRQTKTSRLVATPRARFGAVFSSDGRYLVYQDINDEKFDSSGTLHGYGALVWNDLQTGKGGRITPDFSIPLANEKHEWPALSADGMHLAFVTANAILAGDGNNVSDVYVANIRP